MKLAVRSLSLNRFFFAQSPEGDLQGIVFQEQRVASVGKMMAGGTFQRKLRHVNRAFAELEMQMAGDGGPGVDAIVKADIAGHPAGELYQVC